MNTKTLGISALVMFALFVGLLPVSVSRAQNSDLSKPATTGSTQPTVDGNGNGGAGDPFEPAESVRFVQTLRQFNWGAREIAGDGAGVFDSFWLPGAGGAFVLNNNDCNPYSTNNGVWSYRDSGAQLTDKHFCSDVLAAGHSSHNLNLWQHAWALNTQAEQVSDTSFVKVGTPTSGGWAYPLVLYTLTDSGLTVSARQWATLTGANTPSTPPGAYSNYFTDANGVHTPGVTRVAYVGNNTLFAEGQEGSSRFLATYSLPTFTQTDKWSRNNVFSIVGGIGNGYFLASENFSAGVYKLTNNRPEKVSDLDYFLGTINSLKIDPTNPNRIAVQALPSAAHRNFSRTFFVYDVNVNGSLTEARSYPAPAANYVPFAIADDYFAYQPNEAGSMKVFKGATELTTDRYPKVKNFVQTNNEETNSSGADVLSDFGFASSLAISPTGKIIVTGHNGVLLYEIGGFDGGTVPPPPVSGGDLTADVKTFLSFAGAYLNVLRGFIGNDPVYDNKAFPPKTATTSSAAFEDAYLEALRQLQGEE